MATTRRSILLLFFLLCFATLAPTAQGQGCDITCAAGTYFVDCSTGCVQCPKGFYCPVGSKNPTACSAGTSSTTLGASASSTCVNCAAGYVAPSEGSSACTLCTDFTKAVNRTICEDCPAGLWQVGGTGCSVCLPGQYGDRTTKTCKSCTAGFICPTQSVDKEVGCAAGTYANAGSSSCLPCPAGSACGAQVGLSGALTCQLGSYSTLGSSVCTRCPPNMFCPTTNQAPTVANVCPAGSFSIGNQSACIVCPAGSYCNGGTVSGFPISCPPGSFSSAGSSACSPCPAGYGCANSTSAQLCPSGFYSPLGQTVCTACPAGSYCPNATVALLCPKGTYSNGTSASCASCPAGFYANNTGSNRCTPCPSEFYCPSPSSDPVACQKGYTSSLASTACVACRLGSSWNRRCEACPQGFYCPAVAMDPVPCPAGTYSGVNQSACTLCPAGFACPNRTAIPQPCVLGTYSSGGLGSCLPCPVDYSCTVIGNLTQCDVAHGFYSPIGDASCYLCPAGRVCLTAAGTNTSVVCAPGTYRIAGTATCVLCPPGYMCPYPQFGPMRCPKGAYSGVGALSCSMCPVGYACNNRTQPISCLYGTYSNGGDEECTECPAGFACPSPINSPKPCLPGTYALSGSTNCTACPRGFACPSTMNPTLIRCPNGTYATGSASQCTLCPPGFYCPSTDFSIQIPCRVGTYSYAGQSNCTSCPASWACPSTNAAVQPPRKCLHGTFSIGESTQCTVCPAGYECPFDDRNYMVPCKNGTFSEPGQRSCSNCSVGYYCPLTAVSPTQPFIGVFGVGRQVLCPPGTFSNANQQECTRCPQGYYCTSTAGPTGGATACPVGKLTTRLGQYVDSGATECSDCPPGYSCDGAGASATTCSPGTYSLGSVCTPCPSGFECPFSNQDPSPCPAGTYSSTGWTSCRPCAAGYICGQESTVSTPAIGKCPLGSYCPSGATSPTLCPAGTFGEFDGGTSMEQVCRDCYAGKTCPAGTQGSAGQITCPTGSYCPPGSPFPTPCPSGTYSATLGAQTRATCLLCPEQFFCPAGSSAYDANPCPPGYYCPAGSGSGFENGCPVGTFSPELKLSSPTQCFVCPKGAYCPIVGLSAPTPCSPGTYQPNTGSASCIPCEEGWACPDVGQVSSHEHACAQGHFCPRGSSDPEANPCPGGSYTFRTNLASHTQCEACWRGYACPPGTGLSPNDQPRVCPAGFYCPGASPPVNGERTFISQYAGTVTVHDKQFMCPQGTYSASTGLWAAEQCVPCPAGSWCPGGGSNAAMQCSAGYYCPMGSFKSTQVPCEAGTYGPTIGLESQAACSECRSGYYCPEAATSPISCPAGTYSPFNRTIGRGPALSITERNCLQCPAGYYCPLGSTKALPCPVGTYSAEQSWTCTVCEAGRYCPQVATTRAKKDGVYQCPAGLYCTAGMDRMPSIEYDPCPAGSYCPLGAVAPVKCFPGTYNSKAGRASIMDCVECEAGYYCALSGATNVTGECAPGHYCPIGSSSATQEPCPARYYRSATRGETSEFCSVCPRGTYCPEGCSTPVACPQGYYCLDGSDIPEPCPIGTFGNRTGLRARSECSACTSGYYCDGLGLSHPTGLCDPGYYCIGRAFSSAPPGLPTGGLCPKGGYCPPGSSLPTACAEGTFNNNTGGSTQQDCVTCTPGYYCAGSNLPFPTGPCAPGYYCTGGASKPTQFRTPAGHYSLSGAAAPSECALGTYNPLPGQGACTACVIGNYCPIRALVNYIICPPGGYCPAASITPRACPAGTFQPYTNRQNITNCVPCSPGHYCQSDNLTAPTAECSPGFYCKRWCITTTCGRYLSNYVAIENAMANNGIENNIGGTCPYGKYCEGGTSYPQLCPVGTVRDAIQGVRESDCRSCPARYYCPNSGMSTLIPSNRPILCEAGYYCPGPIVLNSNIGCSDPTCANHTGEDCSKAYIDCSGTNSFLQGAGPRRCPQGFHCPLGSDQPLLCFLTGAGKTTYQDEYGQVTCKMCPEGFWCDPNILASVKTPQPCPIGRYCPKGTSSNQPKCPEGTWSNVTQLSNFSQCAQCPPTRYCPSRGIYEIKESITPLCSAGYYCTAGAKNTFGVAGTMSGIGGICPPGHYCPNGTATNVSYPCPPGTFKPSWFGTSVRACVACTGGFYCAGTANTKTTAICNDGYYCPTSCSDAECMNFGCQNSQIGFPGGACPVGHYCKGTGTVGPVLPKQCPEGTYQNETAQSNCKLCPPGFFCGPGEVDPRPCGVGRYCPNGTRVTSIPRCPPGTYNNNEFAQDLSECSLCRNGHYCPEYGMNSTDNLCASGFYCTSGAMSPTGDLGPLGGITGVCPQGHYCPLGTSVGTDYPCPIGTFLSFTGAKNISMCVHCSPGMHCNSTGLRAVTGPCEAGYYCPRRCEDRFCSNAPCSGSLVGGACPPGFFCPQRSIGSRVEGAYQPTPCPAGTFAPTEGHPVCLLCPAGSWCSLGSSVPQACPTGHYCPSGTTQPTANPCPTGTYQPSQNATSLNDCLLCSSGMYCEGSGLSSPSGDCFAGVYCTSGASTPSALLGPQGGVGGVCDAGYYCPNATRFYNEFPCPAGTYQPYVGTTSGLACLACAPGFYCPNISQHASVDKCTPGYYCPRACNDSTCSNLQCNSLCSSADLTRGGACPPGYICPQEDTRGAIFPTACPSGTYNPNVAATTCLICPAGFFCGPATSVPEPCPLGGYCPDGTDLTVPQCPAGTYNDKRNGSSVYDCVLCPAGKYCPQSGNSSFYDDCFGGYYCVSGAVSGRGESGYLGGEGGICPVGHFCPPGTEYPKQFACPPGTFNPKTGSSSADDCIPCTRGFYCLTSGLKNVTGRCDAGHFCPIACIDSHCLSQYVPLNNNTLGGPCPEGTFCPLIEMEYPVATKIHGVTMIRGSSSPVTCAMGFYAPSVGSVACVLCPEGHYCVPGEKGARPCPAGSYCPFGTGTTIPLCPPGSFSSATGLNASSQCTLCPAGRECPQYGMTNPGGPCSRGYFCLGGALNPFGIVGSMGGIVSGYPSDAFGRSVCPLGHYCPTGTSYPIRCPAGTYNPVLGGWNLTQSCLACDGGKYCATPGLSSANGTCFGGYYCPRGCIDPRCFSRVSQGLSGGLCPVGFYCPPGTATPIACPAGTTTSSQGATACPTCPASFYCPGGGSAVPCPAGGYCPAGTTSSIPLCPNGTFSNLTMRSSPLDCQRCSPKMACTAVGLISPDATCISGYYCETGASTVKGELGIAGGVAGICPAGHYCPEATDAPFPCPIGTYLPSTGAHSENECIMCTPGRFCGRAGLTGTEGLCSEGFFCPGNQTLPNPPDYRCPRGNYCPAGSIAPTECPAGTFNAFEQIGNISGCLLCPQGKYCLAGEVAAGTANCPAGWYCSGGTSSSQPASNGGSCVLGYYCPEGSSFMIPCPPGLVCDQALLSEPSGLCGEGYYCIQGANNSEPTDGVTGNLCPPGSYCPTNSSSPTPCPSGTYNPVSNQASIYSCVPCRSGFYCPSVGMVTADALCSVGYYCPPGQITGTPGNFICPIGFYCPAGTPVPRRCPIGTYQDTEGMGYCKSCPPGYFCNPKNLCPGSNASLPTLCPAGYFCPNGTRFAEEHPCPKGTYNPVEGALLPESCLLCAAGRYCPTQHMSAPGPNCTAGYICLNGSSIASPVDGVHGYICPEGHYCPSGATSPIACPPGTFSSSTGLSFASECSVCTPGSFCGSSGLTEPSGVCDANYYCPGGQSVANPVDHVCPYGQICLKGSATWSFVPSGNFVDTTGASTFKPCSAGAYCDALLPCQNCSIQPCVGNYTCRRACPVGYYCPEGTLFDSQFPCPIGTFGASSGLSKSAQCSACAPGHFCPFTGMVPSTILKCQAGYICTGGSTKPQPIDGTTGYRCPSGSYCPSGALAPTPCPQGSFNPSFGTTNKSACIRCPVGRACTQPGLSAPDAICSPGYYCPGGLISATNPQYLCPQGYYCPQGTANPILCQIGTWTATKGRDKCDACPAGYYCNTQDTCPGSNVTNPRLCFAGHYCPSGTGFGDQFPCPIGTFSTRLGVSSPSNCALCPAGFACPNPGMFEPLPKCLPGHYCRLGAKVVNPSDGNITGDVCPRGYYCPLQTGSPIGCPIGTFSSSLGLVNGSQCALCTPGSYCGSTGLSAPSGLCAGGYYCGMNETMTNPPDKLCPTGKYCPVGATAPLDCPNGTFVMEGLVGQAVCSKCPAGYYCNLVQQKDDVNATTPFVVPQPCPKGYYCLEGTRYKNEHPCPSGTFSQLELLQLARECAPCPPGLYCALPGQVEPAGRCLPGFVCKGGSNTSAPTQPEIPSSIGGLCPTGHFCPIGSMSGVPCPPGTYFGGIGAKNASACSKCRPGYYCPDSAMTIPTGAGPCSANYYCPGGDASPSNPSLICPRGHFCPIGTPSPVPCPGGSYSPNVGASVCQGCPEYYFCPKATVTPIICYNRHVCAANTSYPAICRNGTYAQTNVAMRDQAECVLCPAGVYCHNGTISGPCAAGYLCEYGNWVPSPSSSTDVVSVKKGGLCPLGHYCPMGTTAKRPCTNQTVGYTLGLQAPTDCSPCRSGYYCLETSVIPIDCPPGYYCPGYVGRSIGLIPCPVGTYNTKYFATDISYCLPCQAGYYCPLEAMASSSVFPVPSGFYSSTGQIKPYPCPGGTYQPKSNGSAAGTAACLTCPVGHYCGPQSSTWNQTCPEGAYCPPGSTYPLHCPGASYCPRNTYAPIDCPAGYYCPPRSPMPLLCWNGTFCPPRTESPHMCPNGYVSRNDTTARWEMEDSCQICPPGTFSTNTLFCEPCTAGYVCLGGTTVARPLDVATERGYICPIGYYCPSGSSSPLPCPPGTYNNGTGGRTINACSDCQPNYYQPDYAQSTCIRCGKSATSPPGSPGCDCLGRYRSFQPGDGSCRCIPGYVFYTEGQKLSEDDSPLSCQPKIYPRCQPNTYRSSNGDCVAVDSSAVCSFCPNGLGSVDPQIGVCRCDEIQTYEETCDEACIKESSTITMDARANVLVHYDPKTGTTKSIGLDSSGVLGTRNCAAGASSCDVKMMRMDDSGIYGIFNPSFDTIEAGTTAPQNTSSGASLRRQLLQTQSQLSEKPISSPIVCLGFGDAVIWDVSHPSRQHFPVYVKDSLLNTNPDFDYTEFRDLSEKIAAPNFTLTAFIYTFNKAGVYTFADNADIFRITVIRVVSENEVCPASPYEPYTQSSLVSMGVVRDRDLILQPDWALIGALIGALVVLVVGTIFALWLFRRQRWGVVGSALPRYREHGITSLNEREFANLASKGSTTKRHQLTASGLERVQPPPGSSRPLTMRLDVHMSEFDVDYFCSTIAEEAGVEEGNVLVLTTTDEGKIMVRFVFTGIDDPDSVADYLISRILAEGDEQSDLHSHLNILGFEDSAQNFNEAPFDGYGGGGGGGAGLNITEMEDEFWDYERQIDLEGFNIRTLYSRLEDQTIHVVAQLAHQRDDLILLCDKILVESEALKDMFLRIKIDMDDKNQQVRRINDIREEKIVSGQVEYDLPEDVKQVLGQFLENFFENNLPTIIQNANIQTTNVENRTINVTRQEAAQEYETVVREENPDGTFSTRVEKGKDVFDAARRRPTIARAAPRKSISDTVSTVNELDGFKDMFSTTLTVTKGKKVGDTAVRQQKKSPKKAHTVETLKTLVAKNRKLTKDLPRSLQDDSDCDDDERQERAAARERVLLRRVKRFRRAIDRVTMPSEFILGEALGEILPKEEAEEVVKKRAEWQAKRREERNAADTFPEELLDDSSLPSGERVRRQAERERLLAKRMARMEDVLRFFEIPETLEMKSGASEEEKAELRIKRERFLGQKMEKARRVRAELGVPMNLDDDSEADEEERMELQDKREELVSDFLINNPHVSHLPDPGAASTTKEKELRWVAIDKAISAKLSAAQEAVAERDVPEGHSDHSDLDDEEIARRKRLRTGDTMPASAGSDQTTRKQKSAEKQRVPLCPPVHVDEFKAPTGELPQQYEDDSDMEDEDRERRMALRNAFTGGKASLLSAGEVPEELAPESTAASAAPTVASSSAAAKKPLETGKEEAFRKQLQEAFIKGQIARDAALVMKSSAAKAREIDREVHELLDAGDTEAIRYLEEGKQKEKELLSAPEFEGTNSERKRQAAAYHVGRLAQRMTELPEEMDSNRHNVAPERKKAMAIRAEAFLAGVEDSLAPVPKEYEEKPDMPVNERTTAARAREAFTMGRARAAGELLAKEIEAMATVDEEMSKAMQSARERGVAAAKHGLSEVPIEYRDDVPLLSEGECSRRRRLQAVFIQALKAQQAGSGIDELMDEASLSPDERKAMKKAFERGQLAQKECSKMPSSAEESHETFAAFIQGAHQSRAAEMLKQDALMINQSGLAGKRIVEALNRGRNAQKAVDALPEELLDHTELSAVERADRATRRDAFIVGRKLRQSQALPKELPEDDGAAKRVASTSAVAPQGSSVTSRSGIVARGGKQPASAVEGAVPAALEEAPSAAEDAARLKQHKQALLKRVRERQKEDLAILAEEIEARVDADVVTISNVLEKQFRHEVTELQVRHGIALSKCAPEELEEVREAQSKELTAVAESQKATLRSVEEDVRLVAETTRSKLEEVIATKHLNDARVEASLADQKAKTARALNPALSAKKPSELETVEELKEYTKYLSEDLKQRDRLQAAKVAKEKALLAEQLQLVEKIEMDGLEQRVAKTKARALERAKGLLASAPPQELEEELSRVEKTFALELETERAVLKNRLAEEKIAKTQQLSNAHIAEAESLETQARRETEELVAVSRVLKERAVKAEQELTDDQKRAVEMMMEQERLKEELAQQRRAVAEGAEERERKARVEEKIRSDAAREIARRERENGEKMTEAQRKSILDEFRRDAEKLDAAFSSEEQRQAEARNQRLAQQRLKRERESNLKNLQAMNAETQRQLEEQQRKAAELSRQVPVLAPEEPGISEDENRKKLEAELAAKAAALKKKHEEQKQQLERQLEEELKKHEEREAARMAAEVERKKQALAEEHQKQISQDMTEEQRNALLKAHAEEASRVEEKWAADAAAQLAKIEARKEAHRKKKLAELADKQRAQNADREDESDAARVELDRLAARESEEKRISDAIKKGVNPQQAAEVVLSDRHQREIRQTMERHANRRKDFEEEQAAHLQALEEAKRSVTASTEVEIRAIPEDHPDRERKIAELRKKESKAISKLMEENNERSEVRSDTMEMLIAEELLALKMRQMNEVFEAAGIKSSDAIARYKAKIAGEHSADEDDALSALKKQREEQTAAAQEKLRKDKETREAALRAEFEEMKRLQEIEFKKQKEAMEEQARQDEERIRQKLNAHKAALAKEGKVSTVATEELEALSKNIAIAHAQSVALMEERSRQNQQAQLESYASRLEKRRAGRGGAGKSAAAASVSGKASPTPATVPGRTEISEGVRRLAQLTQPLPQSGVAAAPTGAPTEVSHNVTNVNNFVLQQAGPQVIMQGGQGSSASYPYQEGGAGVAQQQQVVLGMPTAGSAEYQQWILGVVQQMCASPLMMRLEKIERMVEATYNQSGLLSYFLDEKDRAMPTNEGRLEVVDVARLPTAQYVVYGFAAWVMESIQKMGLGVPEVKIAVASSLPDVQSNAIAFRNSYHYDMSRKTLYVRDTRLSTIGEFIVVVLHAIAHIMASNAPERQGVISWNDADPSFLTQFYGLLEVCTEEMFFMRLPKELAARDNVPRASFRPPSIMNAKSLASIGASLKSAGDAADSRQAMLKNSLMLD